MFTLDGENTDVSIDPSLDEEVEELADEVVDAGEVEVLE
jgi:hypothetical protein